MAGRQGTGNRMGRKWRLWKVRAVEMAGLIPVVARGCAWATVFGGICRLAGLVVPVVLIA